MANGPAGMTTRERKSAQSNAKKRADERRANIREQYRANQNKGSGADVRTGGESTGRESGIMASQTKDKIKSLEQSVGSLDRRINEALKQGNTDLAKDLRSRLNVFTTRLGDERAKQIAGGVMRTKDGRIIRTSSGRPVLTSSGLAAFQDTKDIDFLDPTRNLINKYPKEFAKMYPIQDQLRQGLPGTRILKGLAGIKDKQQKLTEQDLPGIRYPLDRGFGAGEGEPEDPMNIADLSFIPETTFGPMTDYEDPDITMAGQEPGSLDVPLPLISVEFDAPLPNQLPIIDPNTRSEVADETMGDIIDSGVQDFAALDKEFQAENERIAKEEEIQRGMEDEMQMRKTAEILGGSGYNLDQSVINDLFSQGLLEEGTNYFPNPRIGNNTLVDQAIQSYYQSLQQ